MTRPRRRRHSSDPDQQGRLSCCSGWVIAVLSTAPQGLGAAGPTSLRCMRTASVISHLRRSPRGREKPDMAAENPDRQPAASRIRMPHWKRSQRACPFDQSAHLVRGAAACATPTAAAAHSQTLKSTTANVDRGRGGLANGTGEMLAGAVLKLLQPVIVNMAR
jgi:hypothetical protein